MKFVFERLYEEIFYLKGQSHENGVSTKAMGSKFCTALKYFKRIPVCDGSLVSSLTPHSLSSHTILVRLSLYGFYGFKGVRSCLTTVFFLSLDL